MDPLLAAAGFGLVGPAVSALVCWRVHRGVGAAALIWAALIGVSTVFTTQHYVVDVVAGTLLACVAYVVFLQPHSRERIAETDRRRAPVRALAVAALFGVMVAGFWVAFRIGGR